MSWRGNGMARARRALALLLLLATSFLVAVVPAAAERPNGAGLVVRFGDGSLVYAYVQFEEESISGEQLLLRSGLAVVVAPYGGLGTGVCAIEGTGCPSDDCYCQSYSQPAWFWHYYARDGGWIEQLRGPSSRTIRDGDIDGWSWTTGDSGLPEVTIDEIAAMNGVDRSDPTPTPEPPPTETPLPPEPTATSPPPPPEATATATSEPPATATAAGRSTPATGITATPTTSSTPTAAAAGGTASATRTPRATATAPAAAASQSPTHAATPPTAATLGATLGPTTVAVLVPPDGTPVALDTSDRDDGGSMRDYVAFSALAALVAAGGVAAVVRARRGS